MRLRRFTRSKCFLFVGFLIACTSVPRTSSATDDPAWLLTKQVVQAHCVKCHGAGKQEGGIRLDDLRIDTDDHSLLNLVEDQLRDGLMPPEQEPRIAEEKLKTVLVWLSRKDDRRKRVLPNQGNLIAHDLLFGKTTPSVAASPARVWRLSPDGYKGFVSEVYRGRLDGVVQPFTVIPERGIKDFAELYAIDEPSTEVLLRNAETIVARQTAHEIKDGKIQGKNDSIGEFVKVMDPALKPDRARLEAALQIQFRLAHARKADASEVDRFMALYDKCAAAGDRPSALKTMLQAVLLRADAVYRSELGTATDDVSGRRKMSPLEVARAVSLALGDRRETGIVQAAEKGELHTQVQLAAQVRRILDDPKINKPGLLRFFREYFEYHRAPDVFKDKPRDRIKHVPQVLVGDTDRLVLHTLDQDKDVLRELLTTRLSFVNYSMKVDKSKPGRPLVGVPFDVIPPPDKNPKNKPEWLGGVDAVYGFTQWPAEQPAQLPSDLRCGILTQPSWLVAWSTNFDNDPVRRGRWIRERLLGGTVPDLPIGVVAQVPDDPHRTLRDRLKVTREAKCWKCHQHMDELGLPFENFDHYGRLRTTETIVAHDSAQRTTEDKGKPPSPTYVEAPLDASGRIAGSGDDSLDGTVTSPVDMLRRLAASDRVRQVFVRHAFRYYLGRNETLADARTLQAADQAYLNGGGSFKALLVSLLTSDSFLYRIDPSPVIERSTSSRADQ